ncbi:pyridoxamine 5'-phosphate oxidase family protein [Humibacter sp. RRB41]|uniref:pyridoxamine 5'-phosphate oxidase family protein n=1 Tax=Humibacter sp. RRB41 TaxID=2919946 RepID=UPI001FA9A138|nr:pyridoxamine 5'-phosphate oxidase family protein [Humibacter sp. RRB41]
MDLTEEQRAFLDSTRSAAMITIGRDGMPKAVRVGVVAVDGHLWSSGTADRTRTKRLRRDPRSTLFVFDGQYRFLTLETGVTLLDGADAPEQSVRLFRAMQSRPTGDLVWNGEELSESDFLAAMVREGRLIYQFDVHKAYGLV